MWEILHEWKVGLFSFRTSLDRWTNRVIYSICGNTSRCFGVAFVACGLWSVEYDTQNLFTVCRDLDMPGWHVGTLVRIFLTFQPISMRLVFEQYSIVISRKVSLTESTYHHRTSQLGQSWWGFGRPRSGQTLFRASWLHQMGSNEVDPSINKHTAMTATFDSLIQQFLQNTALRRPYRDIT